MDTKPMDLTSLTEQTCKARAELEMAIGEEEKAKYDYDDLKAFIVADAASMTKEALEEKGWSDLKGGNADSRAAALNALPELGEAKDIYRRARRFRQGCETAYANARDLMRCAETLSGTARREDH